MKSIKMIEKEIDKININIGIQHLIGHEIKMLTYQIEKLVCYEEMGNIASKVFDCIENNREKCIEKGNLLNIGKCRDCTKYYKGDEINE